MKWYENILIELQRSDRYTRNNLIQRMQKMSPSISRNSAQWGIGELVKSGSLIHTAFDEYRLPDAMIMPVYTPAYTDQAAGLIDDIRKKNPEILFTVFETVMMNEFLNHLIARNTIFLQVEKELSAYVFRCLREEGTPNILYKPGKKEFNLYWKKDCVIVTDLISESPLSKEDHQSISIEKILVDMYCDKLITQTYSKSEYGDAVRQACRHYRVERQRLLRYARRRGKEAEISMYLDSQQGDTDAVS